MYCIVFKTNSLFTYNIEVSVHVHGFRSMIDYPVNKRSGHAFLSGKIAIGFK